MIEISPDKLPEWRKLDTRGYFARCFDSESDVKIKQVNISLTRKKGVVRGLHFLRGIHSEYKEVSVIRGRIFDVVVDLQKMTTQTFELEEGSRLIVPPHHAHGFQALEDETIIMYRVDSSYTERADSGINPLCDYLSIAWPLGITQLSERDSSLPGSRDIEDPFVCACCL